MSLVAVVDHRFAVLDIEQRALEPVGAEIRDCAGLSRDEALAVCAEADAVIVGARFALDGPAIARLGRCKAIVRYGIGYENVDAVSAGAAGIWVVTIPDYCIAEVADHTIACLLLLNRRLVELDHAVRSGAWGIPAGFNVQRLSESVLGVIGFGRIGEAVARRALAFGMRVLAYDPARPEADLREAGVQPTELDEMLPAVNFVTLHAPPPPDGTLLNSGRLDMLPDGAFVINVARGGLIDEEALISGLHSGRIAGAALDVANAEPVRQDDPLLSAPNVLITPHAAWYSRQAVVELREKAASEVARVLSGEQPLHPVNRLSA
jgi:D-3-phosphoglycerate dehydrogenase / 2-oxoglutarate reductase